MYAQIKRFAILIILGISNLAHAQGAINQITKEIEAPAITMPKLTQGTIDIASVTNDAVVKPDHQDAFYRDNIGKFNNAAMLFPTIVDAGIWTANPTHAIQAKLMTSKSAQTLLCSTLSNQMTLDQVALVEGTSYQELTALQNDVLSQYPHDDSAAMFLLRARVLALHFKYTKVEVTQAAAQMNKDCNKNPLDYHAAF
jgi:hypothetical protein